MTEASPQARDSKAVASIAIALTAHVDMRSSSSKHSRAEEVTLRWSSSCNCWRLSSLYVKVLYIRQQPASTFR